MERTANLDRQHRTFPFPDRLSARQPVPQLRLIDLVLGPAAPETRPGLRDAILRSLDGVAARQRPPSPCSVGLQDDVRIYQHGAAMRSHDAS